MEQAYTCVECELQQVVERASEGREEAKDTVLASAIVTQPE
jgi:hypothetical protein